MTREHIHFVTGRLAASALRSTVESLANDVGFRFSVDVLPITVAALMSPQWIASRVKPDSHTTRVVVPGYCRGDLKPIEAATGLPVERGPKDLRRLPEFFGQESPLRRELGAFDIEILAEINHAPEYSVSELLTQARQLVAAGADIVDLGCQPGYRWANAEACVRALREEGIRVSIDSLDVQEISAAVRGGAEFVLSVNSSNRDAAPDWGCPVVVIPDDPASMSGLDENAQWLTSRGVPVWLDPILEPIGCGFAASLSRYLEVRRRYPEAPMLMGIGNLTELTDVDSAGVNVLLLGFCQELGIRRVLTTQVINWARTSVRECDLARRLVRLACAERIPPKHLEPQLITLRDPKLYEFSPEQLDELAQQVRDRNFRIFVAQGAMHLMAAGRHWTGTNPFALFQQATKDVPKPVDADHAFYLGFELAKAYTALKLGKQYEQDEPLDWGYLRADEPWHGRSADDEEEGRGGGE